MNNCGPQYDITINPNSQFMATIYMPTRDWASREGYHDAIGLKFFLLRKGRVSCKIVWIHGYLDRQSEKYYYNRGKKLFEREE